MTIEEANINVIKRKIISLENIIKAVEKDYIYGIKNILWLMLFMAKISNLVELSYWWFSIPLVLVTIRSSIVSSIKRKIEKLYSELDAIEYNKTH